MPTIRENRAKWSRYNWQKSHGDEWSYRWGGADYTFFGSLFPRIMPFLPVGRGLEIAPGHGRITQFLNRFCDHLTIVDLVPGCIDACKERFADLDHIDYHVNDGKSLAMVPDGSIDFALSFDSLVHADDDVLEAYVSQLPSKLSAQGVAFVHHSNLKPFCDPNTGVPSFENRHWRSPKVSADDIRTWADAAGGVCFAQELINWGRDGTVLHDCFSWITPKGSPHAREPRRRENPCFMDEVDGWGEVAELIDDRDLSPPQT